MMNLLLDQLRIRLEHIRLQHQRQKSVLTISPSSSLAMPKSLSFTSPLLKNEKIKITTGEMRGPGKWTQV